MRLSRSRRIPGSPPRRPRLSSPVRRGPRAIAVLLGAALIAAPLTPLVAAPEIAHAATIPVVGCTTNPKIFNTGYDAASGGQIANGASDQRWQVAGGYDGIDWGPDMRSGPSPAALPPAGTTYGDAYAGRVNELWNQSQSGDSQWISARYVDPSNGQNQRSGHGDWYYRYQFTLDPAVDPSTFRLDMSWWADNSVVGVWVNDTAQRGANLPQSPGDPYNGVGFQGAQAARTSLSSGWRTGLNTILVQIKSNDPAQGFNAVVDSTALCPTYAVSKTASTAVAYEGDKVTYTVSVKNTSGAAFTADNPASFRDDLSQVADDATYDGDASGGATVDGDTLSWSGPLAVGETKKITYSYTVNRPDGGDKRLINTVAPTSRYGTCDPTAVCTTTTLVRSYTVSKTADRDTVVPGARVTYTVTVTSTGTADYTEQEPASFTDDLSKVTDDATYDGDATNGATVDGNTLRWAGALAAGETKTIVYSFTVNDPDTGDRHLGNAVVPTGPGGGCIGPCKTMTLVQSYSVTKSASTSTAKPGETVTYTITVVNTGEVPYTAQHPASFRDDVSAVVDDARYNHDATEGAVLDGTTLSWSGPLARGETKTIVYSFTVNDPDTGDRTLVNAVVPSTPGGKCIGSCTTQTTVFVPPPGPSAATGGSIVTGAPTWPWAGVGVLGLIVLVGLGVTRPRRARVATGDTE